MKVEKKYGTDKAVYEPVITINGIDEDTLLEILESAETNEEASPEVRSFASEIREMVSGLDCGQSAEY